MRAKKPITINANEAEALLSAIYTQIESLKNYPGNKAEAARERRLLRSAEKKLRKVLRLVTS